MKVMNHDVAGLCHRINRFRVEMIKSQSSGVSSFSSFEAERLRSYIAALRKYVTWVMSSPLLDLPESSPEDVEVRELTPTPDMENEAVVDIVRLLGLSYVELIHSQSARLASGLSVHDHRRFVALVDKVESFLESYIVDVAPLDLPESSPRAEMTGHGNRGVGTQK